MNASSAASRNSTIVLSRISLWAVIRAYFAIVSRLLPDLARRHAERLFTAPPRYAGRRRQSLDARRETVVSGKHSLAVWQAGPLVAPAVLLVHGWGGRGTQLGAFVDPLVTRGFSVVAFDAPGHGVAEPGLVTIPEMTAALRAVADTQRPLAGLIAHSAGAAVAARALYEGLRAASVVLVAPAAELATPAAAFARGLGFSLGVSERMRERIEERVGKPFSAFDVTTLGPALGMPLQVAHDWSDSEVPWQDGRLVTRSWAGPAELLTTDGLGHRRILRDPGVVGAAVAFIAARTQSVPTAA